MQNAANAEESASASEVMSSQAGQLNKFVSDLVLLVRGNGRPEIKNGKSGAKREPEQQIARHSAKTKATGLKAKNGNGYGVKGSGYAPDAPASAVIPFDDESMKDF